MGCGFFLANQPKHWSLLDSLLYLMFLCKVIWQNNIHADEEIWCINCTKDLIFALLLYLPLYNCRQLTNYCVKHSSSFALDSHKRQQRKIGQMLSTLDKKAIDLLSRCMLRTSVSPNICYMYHVLLRVRNVFLRQHHLL